MPASTPSLRRRARRAWAFWSTGFCAVASCFAWRASSVLARFWSHEAAQSGATADLGLVPDSPGKYAQVYGAYLWAFLLLIAVLAVLMRRGRPARSGVESPTGA